MTTKGLPFFAMGLMLCMVCVGCGSSSSDTGAQVTIATSTLPVGTVGSTYSYSIPATGGTPPYVWNLSSGTLPAGLGLTTKGNIHGTPVASGATTFTIAVQDSEAVPASTTATFSLTVESELVITSISLPPATIDVNYTANLGAAGGTVPYAWSLTEGNLPPGIKLSTAGVIYGTPSATGTWMFTVQVTDSESNAQTAVQQLQIAVNPE